ncbi:MAG: glycosyltransferase family 4 protein [Bacteroidota bacterium]
MKILLVSWSTLPNKGGSSIIVENLAKNFSADEMIVLGSRTWWQDTHVERPPGIAKFVYFFSELYFFGRGYRYFIWFRKWRFRPLIQRIKNIIQTENITHVIGVYPNPFYCHAACIAAKELGVPFSSYFHNTYVENVAITDPQAPAIQAEIFAQSEFVFVMSKGMQKFYEEKYQLKKFIPLVHTFDEFPSTSSLTGIPGEDKSKYKLVAIGNFNESNLDATRRFIEAIKSDPRYQLSLFTHVPKVLLKNRGIDVEVIDYQGFVSPDEVHERLQNYDICVLTHGFTGGYGAVEYQTIFPTRTIPFLLSGKPILAHSPDGSFLNDFILENKCAVLVAEKSTDAILAGLEKITKRASYQKELVAASQKTAAQFYGKKVVAKLKNTLSQSVNSKV